ncbi:transposable element Tcb2 transposase [Trichonephila clavipes]|nr:transposable element Tcb2 transposase [Trichonephila clavipes]
MRRYPRAENRVWSDQEDHEERGSKDRAASTCGPHSDSFNDTRRHWQKVVFSDEFRFVLGIDDNRVRVWRRPEHVWDQIKQQMPSRNSVHDLELDVQDMWAHLPRDNIRCLINSMPDRVEACIAAGGGPTRY